MSDDGEDGPRYVFWREGFEGVADGEMFVRGFPARTFIENCESKGYVIAGLVITAGSNNIEVLHQKPGVAYPTPDEAEAALREAGRGQQ